ncbi:MAG: hypothetical protein AMJ65_16450 [Phycisphaerae bacterium SG8_4]|nr:MAG: hypothetical protein AMJ65_16450 [Phycisphaerae bacterium SG8_4]
MALTKTSGDGKAYPAAAWLYKPDPSKPSTWKLRFKEYVNGQLKVTRRILGMAHAALTKGFRGSKVQLPAGVKSKLLARVKSMLNSLGASKEQVQIEFDLLKDCGYLPDVVEESTEGMIYDTFEEVSMEPGKVEIDRDNGILKNVAILGLVSKNGRRYMEEAVKDAVTRGIYEGLPCYKDHSGGKSRKIDELIGSWSNTRFDEATKRVRGNLKTLEGHRGLVLDLVDNGPQLAAPSHVVEGKTRRIKEGDKVVEVVEYIGRGHSVDLVAGAATVNSLLEADTKQEVDTMTDNKELESYVDENSPTDNSGLEKVVEALREDIKALRDENAELKKSNDNAEKVAFQAALREAVNSAALPPEIRETVYEDNKDEVLSADDTKALIEGYEAFAKSCGYKHGEPEPRVPVEEAEEWEQEKPSLSKAVKKRLKLDKQK